MPPNYIVSFSGGKDSTVTVLTMLDRGESIHSMVYFDTGWDFPQIVEHIARLEEYTGVPLVRLKSQKSFEYWMFKHPIKKRTGPLKGQIHRIGNGWASPTRRWCTKIKVEAINKYAKTIGNSIQCIGFAYDEQHRLLKKNIQKKIIEGMVRFPLIENKITEKDALQICYRHGFDFGGLYQYFDRVSCWCCPLQSLQDLKTLRAYFPHYWKKMLEMDSKKPEHNKGFRKYDTVHDLERRFASEDRMLRICDENYYEIMTP